MKLLDAPVDVDTDQDNKINRYDADIDGDGIINVLDADADGDGLIDIFDSDIDGDGAVDSAALLHYPGSQYFPEGLESLAVQVMQQMEPQDAVSTVLQISVKIRSGVVPTTIRLEGPAVLISDAQSVLIDPVSGAETSQAWDGTLVDDGANQDGVAGDGIYARMVSLAGSKKPKPNQLIFVVLETSENGVVLVRKFPFIFSAVQAGTLTGSWSQDSKTMTLGGTLFTNFATGNAITDFTWSIHLFDGDGAKVFSSDPIAGSTTSFVLPATYLESGVTYTAYLAARSIAKIAGFPAWVLKSETIPLE
jgi:hypothetical protein